MLEKTEQNQIKLISEEKNIDTGMVTLTIRVPLQSGGTCEIRLPRADLDDQKKMKTILLNKGCPKLHDLREQLDRVLESNAFQKFETTNRAGWHGKQLITRYGTYSRAYNNEGIQSSPFILFDKNHPMAANSTVLGNIKSYSKALHKALSKSNYLTFMLCAALAPALADRLGLSGAYGFNLSGQSSTGKTLSLRLCQSVYGRATGHDLTSFGNTTGYMLNNLSAFGGICVPFTDPKATREKGATLCEKIQTIIFSGHDGVQRQGLNSEKTTEARFFISLFNSERPLSDIFREAGYPYEKGEMVRLIDIPVPTKGGIFDKLDSENYEASSPYAQCVEQAITENYGVLFPEWVDLLSITPLNVIKSKFKRYEKIFLEHISDNRDAKKRLVPLLPEEERMAKAFALVAIAGYMAGIHETFNLPKSSVENAAATLFERARELMSNNGSITADSATNFDHFLKEANSLPLIKLGETANKSECSAGFRRQEEDTSWLYMKRDVFDQYFGNSTNLEKIIFPRLHKLEILTKYKKGWTTAIQQKGLGRLRLMQINLSKFNLIN